MGYDATFDCSRSNIIGDAKKFGIPVVPSLLVWKCLLTRLVPSCSKETNAHHHITFSTVEGKKVLNFLKAQLPQLQ